jgi:hypothetical protein
MKLSGLLNVRILHSTLSGFLGKRQLLILSRGGM